MEVGQQSWDYDVPNNQQEIMIHGVRRELKKQTNNIRMQQQQKGILWMNRIWDSGGKTYQDKGIEHANWEMGGGMGVGCYNVKF